MSPTCSDSTPEAEDAQIEILRSTPYWRKFELVCDLIATARELALAALRERFPKASEGELQRRLATIVVGPELAAKVYGSEPDPPTMCEVPPAFLAKINAYVDTVVLKEKLKGLQGGP